VKKIAVNHLYPTLTLNGFNHDSSGIIGEDRFDRSPVIEGRIIKTRQEGGQTLVELWFDPSP